jgi:hypothetical protein
MRAMFEQGEDTTGTRWTIVSRSLRGFAAYEAWCAGAEASRDPQFYA